MSLKESLLEKGIQDRDENGAASDERSSFYKVSWALAMLCSGTFTTLFAKSLFETNGEGTETCNVDDDFDKNCPFDKPWFTVLLMKLAMSFCLIIYYLFGWGKENPNTPNPSWKTIKAVIMPASLDLLNTVLGNVGLLWVNSSIYQMTRGSVVVFSAILSVRWLGRRLRSFHYYSIALVIVAIILVGTAGVQQSNDDSTDVGMTICGLGFILAAQAVTAIQFTVEESLMTNKETALDPVALVGFEGMWGVLMFIVLAPILTFTPRSGEDISIVWHEDFGDTFAKLSNSTDLSLLAFGYSVAIFFYNISANFVTQCLSSVVRSILEACRVMGVWFVGLMFFYLGTDSQSQIGEEWSDWSYLQLGGFAVLLYGTFSYKALVKMPCVDEEIYGLAIRDEEELANKNLFDDKFGLQ
jgi:drug/metabolite transporter (DMT)-like permease